ncbi:MAG: glycoside hydrolase family 9 protein [Kiritimatiellae bacterium]|nr:glycoside hydrolase family 9 protein [Kiritimatiellia bacterium]
MITLFGNSACGVSLGLGIRERIDQALAHDGTTSDWSGVALTPSLIRFSCRQIGEPRPDNVLRKIRDFRSKCTAYWPRPIGISRHEKKGRYGVWNAADVEHQVWLRTEQPMKEGETRAFSLPDGKRVDFTYHAAAPTPIIKSDQLGDGATAEAKYAYVGEWAGTGGEADLKVGAFALIDERTGEAVCRGMAKRRMADTLAEGVTPWTGETPWELDFSKVSTPGQYYLEVEGVGRSDSFPISRMSLEHALGVHLEGMRRQRCGMGCHQYAFRGNFPADDHYGTLGAACDYGFFDGQGKRARDVVHFGVIRSNADTCRNNESVRVEGGWHDAADYDRRPYHLQAVGDFAAVALLRPACTNLLEEAFWGLRHLLAVQEANGGVGTWIETLGHPGPGEGPNSERKDHDYFISRPTRNSTLEYAAYAAMTALAVREQLVRDEEVRAIWSARYILLTNSAVRAWNFAIDKKSGVSWTVNYGEKVLVYRPDNELRADMLAKAGVDLSLLTGDDAFLEPVQQNLKRVAQAIRLGSNWKASPLIFIEFDHFERMLDGFLRVPCKDYVRKVTSEADAIVDQLNSAWPYRAPWHAPQSWHARKMGWGFNLPLTRARVLIAAHAMTWQDKYIQAAYLANDFHNGANPEGETYTSGLGIRSTERYLNLEGCYPPGITPFRLSYFVEPKCVAWALPDGLDKLWPIWRRYANVEIGAIRSAEFSVWETIAPAAAVTGYLVDYARREQTR